MEVIVRMLEVLLACAGVFGVFCLLVVIAAASLVAEDQKEEKHERPEDRLPGAG